jgi:GNAT superfamily N-acetyltransferase
MLFEGGYDTGIKERYPAVYFGLFVSGQLVAVNSGHFSSPTDFRSRGLCVLPEFRGCGHAGTLLDMVIRYGRRERRRANLELPERIRLAGLREKGIPPNQPAAPGRRSQPLRLS